MTEIPHSSDRSDDDSAESAPVERNAPHLSMENQVSEGSQDTPCETTGGANVGETLTAIQKQLDHLGLVFETKIKVDAGREQVIDRLHEELQEYKADLVLKFLRPLALDMIHLHDDLTKCLRANQDKVEGNELATKLLKMYGDFQSDIEYVLERNGFAIFRSPEESFDAQHQQAIKQIATDDADQGRVIAQRLHPGLKYGERVVRNELVAVYVYKQPPREPSPTDAAVAEQAASEPSPTQSFDPEIQDSDSDEPTPGAP